MKYILTCALFVFAPMFASAQTVAEAFVLSIKSAASDKMTLWEGFDAYNQVKASYEKGRLAAFVKQYNVNNAKSKTVEDNIDKASQLLSIADNFNKAGGYRYSSSVKSWNKGVGTTLSKAGGLYSVAQAEAAAAWTLSEHAYVANIAAKKLNDSIETWLGANP